MHYVHSGILVALFDFSSLYIATYSIFQGCCPLNLALHYVPFYNNNQVMLYTPSDAETSNFISSLPKPLSIPYMVSGYRVSKITKTFQNQNLLE